MMKNIMIVMVVLVSFVPLDLMAGRSCVERKITPAQMQKASDMAVKLYNYLENSDANVALLARVGADLREYDLKYSHMAIALRNHPKGRWFVVHELNQCSTDISQIYDEGLVNFFLDDPYMYDSMVVIPSVEIQDDIYDFIDYHGARKVHNKKYSMISNPYSMKYQNSNEFILSILLAAMHTKTSSDYSAENMIKIVKNSQYKPEIVKIGLLKRMGADIFKSNVSFDDHKGGKINFVSVKSVVDYVKKIDTDSVVLELKPM